MIYPKKFQMEDSTLVSTPMVSGYKLRKDDSSPECKEAWNDFWEENYYPEEYKKNKVKR